MLECNLKYCYENIFKIRNISFVVFKISIFF